MTPDELAFLQSMATKAPASMRAQWQARIAAAKKAPARREAPALRTAPVVASTPIAEYGPSPDLAPKPAEPPPYKVLPPPSGRPASPSQSPQTAQLDAMRKDVTQFGQPPGTQVAGERGTPEGHEVGDEMALIRQQAEVDEYGRTLLATMADAMRKAYESVQKGGPNFVPVHDHRNGKLYLVTAGGTKFSFDTFDPADMAHFNKAMASAKLDPGQVVEWANTVSQPLRGLVGPTGQGGAPAPQQGPSTVSHAEFVERLKQARTPQEADAIVSEHPLFGAGALGGGDEPQQGASQFQSPQLAPQTQGALAAKGPAPQPKGVAAVLSRGNLFAPEPPPQYDDRLYPEGASLKMPNPYAQR